MLTPVLSPTLRPALLAAAAAVLLSALPAAAQEPTALTVSPALPTTEDRLRLVFSGFGCAPQLEPPVVEGKTILWQGTPIFCIRPTYWRLAASLSPLPAGTYTAQVIVGGEVIAATDFVVRAPSEILLLHGGRFRAILLWTNPQDRIIRPARPVSVSDLGGYFWFGGPNNPEVAVKLLDGGGINGHYWVMASSLTTLAFALTITDIGDGDCLAGHGEESAGRFATRLYEEAHPFFCPTRTYQQIAGRNRNFLDFQAFPSE